MEKDFAALHQDLISKSSQTRGLDWREDSLRRLADVIRQHEVEILEALEKDLGKSDFEAFATEVGFVLEEIRNALREFRDWSRVQRVSTPIKIFPARSEVHPVPKGTVLIVSPWNYPFQLAIAPLVAAIAAGNTCALKVSEFAPATAEVTARIIKRTWPDGHVVAVLGDAEVASKLMDRRWDHVFFTGGTEIGRKVMMTCAKHLTPVTLELGGKSPCVIDRELDLEVAARRVAWGKTVNAGQTCIAPDFLAVHRDVKVKFVEALRQALEEFYGENPLDSRWYGKIVSDRHFARLENMLEGATVLFGGKRDRTTRRFAPTAVEVRDLEHPLMKEEIFGPILPILTWETDEELSRILNLHPRPLAFYVFSKRSSFADSLVKTFSFGGACVNDTLLHIANGELPFGGIGESGIGAYHGQYGFDVFSHRKAVVVRPFWMDLKLRYPPYPSSWKKIKGLLQ